jgi:hypothetical protein
MHTFGAVVLAIVGTILMQVLLALIDSIFWAPMYNSVGPILPTILLVGLMGFAYFGGTTFALGVVPKSNPTIVSSVIIAIVLIGTILQVSKNSSTDHAFVYVLQILSGISAAFGALVARSANARATEI